MNPGETVLTRMPRGATRWPALAVGAQRRLGRRVAQCSVVQRHSALNGPDVHDGPAARLDHRGQQCAIEPDRGEQVQAELVGPVVVGEGGEATRRGTGPTGHVHQHLRGAVPRDVLGHRPYPVGGADIGSHEVVGDRVTGAARHSR